MADFFIRRPIVAMVIAILTVIVGAISLSRLPISEYPPVSPTMIQVTTTYRGAAAEAVMESVATPIESKVNGVDKLLYMQSYNANDGKLTLNVYFDVGVILNYTGAMSSHILGEALELSPFTKQLFSSDAFGVAEFHYLGALLFRRALRQHLDRWIVDGMCNTKEAERIVRLIAVDNARRIYPLQ